MSPDMVVKLPSQSIFTPLFLCSSTSEGMATKDIRATIATNIEPIQKYQLQVRNSAATPLKMKSANVSEFEALRDGRDTLLASQFAQTYARRNPKKNPSTPIPP